MQRTLRDSELDSSRTITTDVIKRICVQRGFYRNPVCNDKLYLHQKGFDSIELDAFDPYTDVKVLWLESNALSSIACGKDSMTVAHSTATEGEEKAADQRKTAAAEEGGKNDTNVFSATGHSKSTHVDCAADWAASDAHPAASKEETENLNVVDAAGAVSERKDVFQSLYPTLRQLYLHNNALREVPDISGFQRLDSVNLSGNVIRRVRAHCAVFDSRVAVYEKAVETRKRTVLYNSKSMQRELRDREAQLHADGAAVSCESEKHLTGNVESRPAHEKRLAGEAEADIVYYPRPCAAEENDGHTSTSTSAATVTAINTATTNAITATDANTVEVVEECRNTHDPSWDEKRPCIVISPHDSIYGPTDANTIATMDEYQKNGNGGSDEAAMLNEWEQRVSCFADFCPHEPLDVSDSGKLSDDVPSSRRNPCSSVRTLDFSRNYISGVEDIVQLLCFRGLTTLDLSYNQLHDGRGVLLVLSHLPKLRSLKLQGNPLVRSMPQYRKRVLSRCVTLLHLDDRPVFEAERRMVSAWTAGGDEAETRERQRQKEERDTEHIRRLEEFRAVVGRSLAARAAAAAATAAASSSTNGAAQPPENNNDNNNESATSSERDSESDSSNEGEETERTNTSQHEEDGREAQAQETGRLFVPRNSADLDDDEMNIYVPQTQPA